ncbi:MAG: hypothetical protein M1822_005105 [Bathelium mastoideum]|nr:MAG: hypothetical protein M1822_005105 [Bathelium mastoideum]
MASGRIQNGKPGNASGWGFGNGMGGAPLSNPQARMNNPSLSSFSQALGGTQPRSSFQTAEFPTLDGERRQVQPPPGAGIWNRFPREQQGPSQGLPSQGNGSQGTSRQRQPPLTQQGQQSNEAQASTPFGGGNGDGFHFGGQSSFGHLSGAPQSQPSNNEDFPPLGQHGASDTGQDRVAGLGRVNGPAPADLGERNGLDGHALDGLGARSNGLMSPPQISGSSRSPFESAAINRTPFHDSDQNTDAQEPHSAFPGSTSAPPPFQSTSLQDAQQPPIGPPQSQSQQSDQNLGNQIANSTNAIHQLGKKRISEMTELEQYSLEGLFARINPNHPDHSPLALGHDLTTLGIDLNSADPIYPTFGGPFSNPTERPAVPEYNTPQAYHVHNVQPLHSRIPSFSDETLIAIFYQYPRDILQENAAAELYNRDWRWHKKLQQWMMKDLAFGAPISLGPGLEKGWYLFFETTNWRRERREFVLDFSDLDDRHPGNQNPAVRQPGLSFR